MMSLAKHLKMKNQKLEEVPFDEIASYTRIATSIDGNPEDDQRHKEDVYLLAPHVFSDEILGRSIGSGAYRESRFRILVYFLKTGDEDSFFKYLEKINIAVNLKDLLWTDYGPAEKYLDLIDQMIIYLNFDIPPQALKALTDKNFQDHHLYEKLKTYKGLIYKYKLKEK